LLQVVHTGNALPLSLPVDPTAEFESGIVAQLKLIGNDIVAGVSDGTAPFGLIDDVRTTAFTKPQNDEIVIIPVDAIEVDGNGNRVNSNEAVGFLEFSNVVENSFNSTIDVVLNSVNGAIILPAGSVLNYDNGSGLFDSFRVVVSYIYRVTDKPGEDTTIGSGRISIHYQRGIYATDQYDINQIYPLNGALYVGIDGKLTTKQPTDNHPGIAFVTGPPSAVNGTLEFLWL
jgi:hypothetical protein